MGSEKSNIIWPFPQSPSRLFHSFNLDNRCPWRVYFGHWYPSYVHVRRSYAIVFYHDSEIADMCTALAGQLQSLITDRQKSKKKVYKRKEHLSIYKSTHCWIREYGFVIIEMRGLSYP